MIVKEKLASLCMGYCISLMEIGGREYCVTASEARDGEILLIDAATKNVQKIAGLAGGVMSVVPIPEREGEFLAIQKFYPIFDSAAAEIVHCRLESLEGETLTASVRVVTCLPYVHRIALTGRPGARKLIASTLCRSKAFQDDWTQPGSVYEYMLSEDMVAVGQRTLLEGIHKNHGMYEYRKAGGSYVVVSGQEGVWAVDEHGGTRRLCGEPVSDLCFYDADGDGTDEMLCITPFHGDTFKVLKRGAEGWKTLAEAPIHFGHAVWCGLCGGAPLIVCCSRGGEKNTELYRPAWDGNAFRLEKLDADTGVGASNIVARERNGEVVLYAANHGRNETARYTIRL